MSVVVRRIERPSREIIEEFSKLSTSTVHEAMGKTTANAMDPSIKPIGTGMKLAGPAITVLSFPADNITVHKAMTLAEPGDILVVSAYGMAGVMWGGQMTYQAVVQRIGGIVVDGSVRDVSTIRKLGFPCFAKMVTPLGSAKDTPGSVNVPIECGGVIVGPGDIVVGDDDGVVVVPRNIAAEIARKAKERDEKETAMRKLFDQGKTSFDIYGFGKVFEQKGVNEIDRPARSD